VGFLWNPHTTGEASRFPIHFLPVEDAGGGVQVELVTDIRKAAQSLYGQAPLTRVPLLELVDVFLLGMLPYSTTSMFRGVGLQILCRPPTGLYLASVHDLLCISLPILLWLCFNALS
jgi:hypothetical protein